ncbi:nitric oxide reductase [Alicyclobacillus vulcanalis]|uniref:Nitric oxide reductase activation protein n=1 Tax=Alicyclobacillus vulcanalis TaxID=252246 RepID=A0A1N7ND90_9BACL|nr:nitric oxide reductase [Alicyclobacillus vulcanalis]SIS96317.1 Nitric oxide reductase activation protein [Alicyclobacillus vulcanalis]
MFRFTSSYEDEPLLSLYTGLARVLSGDMRLACRYGRLSSLHVASAELVLPEAYRSAGRVGRRSLERAEVYLRAGGNARWTDGRALAQARKEAEAYRAPKLAWQWLLTVEDVRLMRRLSGERPSLSSLFAKRVAFHRRRVKRQAAWRPPVENGAVPAEEVYLALCGDLFQWTDDVRAALSLDTERAARWALERLSQAVSSREVADLSEVWFDLDGQRADRAPEAQARAQAASARSHAKLGSRDEAERPARQRVDLWTRPKDAERGALLQGPAQTGTRAAKAGHGGRPGDDRVQDFDRYASSRLSGPPRRSPARGEQAPAAMGDEPLQAEATDVQGYVIRVRRDVPTSAEADAWLQSVRQAQARDRRRLLELFSRALERRRAWRGGLSRHGRTLRHPERVAFAPYPRVLAKKDVSLRRDVAVQILVDTSGSMEPYLPACKEAIVMLSDVLRALSASFAVSGYWEDDAAGTSASLETIVWDVVRFEQSSDPAALAGVFFLRPEWDNRDGAAIRYASSRLMRRPEAVKWLFVVSDARPAAEGYAGAYEDTRRAVADARARGIRVVHLVVAGEADAALTDAVRYLYGHAFAIATSPADVPLALQTALKKMLPGIAQLR